MTMQVKEKFHNAGKINHYFFSHNSREIPSFGLAHERGERRKKQETQLK